MEKYQTFWRRFFAGIVDGLVFIPLDLGNDLLLRPSRSHAVVISWFLFATLVGWAYGVVLHAMRGQTLGKMALHVKVLDVGETRIPTFMQALLRDSIPIALGAVSAAHFVSKVVTSQGEPFFGFGEDWFWKLMGYAGAAWFLLEVITMLTNRRRRALHDLLAGTVVVRTP